MAGNLLHYTASDELFVLRFHTARGILLGQRFPTYQAAVEHIATRSAPEGVFKVSIGKLSCGELNIPPPHRSLTEILADMDKRRKEKAEKKRAAKFPKRKRSW
jgi:hypothetical protein